MGKGGKDSLGGLSVAAGIQMDGAAPLAPGRRQKPRKGQMAAAVAAAASRSGGFDFPESIVALVLARTSPRDVARLALVNRTFYSASKADLVWDRMLPQGYTRILKRSIVPLPLVNSKKQLYDQLCDHVIVASNSSEGMWIHRPTGAMCHSYSAKSLAVTWGSTAEYWEWSPKLGARFDEVAHLKMVCWLELSGNWKLRLSPGSYTLSWRLHVDADAFGWDKEPVKFTSSTLQGQVTRSSCFLVDCARHQPDSEGESEEDEEPVSVVPAKCRTSGHGWLEYDVAHLTIQPGGKVAQDDGVEVELFFSMEEIASGTWKGGIYIDSIILQPSHILP